MLYGESLSNQVKVRLSTPPAHHRRLSHTSVSMVNIRLLKRHRRHLGNADRKTRCCRRRGRAIIGPGKSHQRQGRASAEETTWQGASKCIFALSRRGDYRTIPAIRDLGYLGTLYFRSIETGCRERLATRNKITLPSSMVTMRKPLRCRWVTL